MIEAIKLDENLQYDGIELVDEGTVSSEFLKVGYTLPLGYIGCKFDSITDSFIPIVPSDLVELEAWNLQVSLDELNADRTREVANIKVTLADTVTVLDGDEVSQGRIGRAILALADDKATTTWVGANENVYNLTRLQFQEALKLAGEAQTAIWVKYATLKYQLENPVEA